MVGQSGADHDARASRRDRGTIADLVGIIKKKKNPPIRASPHFARASGLDAPASITKKIGGFAGVGEGADQILSDFSEARC